MYTDKIPIIRSRMRLLASAAHIAGIAYLNLETDKYQQIYRPLFLVLKQNTEKHYVGISLDDSGKIAFSSGVHKYDYNRRTRQTLQRYFSRRHPKLYLSVGEHEVGEFCSAVMAHATPVLDRFSTLRGSAITGAYCDEIGGDTCMSGENCDKVQIYGENSNVSLLVYSDDKMKARALLWETREGRQVLDRIYPNSGYHVNHYRMYCEKHEIIQRRHNSLPNGSELGSHHSVHLEEASNSLWPYMDTFRYADDCSGEVILNNQGGPYLLNSQEGYIDSCELCADCGEMIEGESYGMDHGEVCETCRSNYFYCDRCDLNHSYDDSEHHEVTITRMSRYETSEVTDYFTYCTECYDEHKKTKKAKKDIEDEG